jgi:hypothetical protein
MQGTNPPPPPPQQQQSNWPMHMNFQNNSDGFPPHQPNNQHKSGGLYHIFICFKFGLIDFDLFIRLDIIRSRNSLVQTILTIQSSATTSSTAKSK